jgi:hypothetical protein
MGSPPPMQPIREQKKSKLPIAAVFVFLLGMAVAPFLIFDELGNPSLSPKREGKLKRELDNLDEAEQYALLARDNGYYPCLSCKASGVDSIQIFLFRGEVWKYGTTTKGEAGRYRKTLVVKKLRYVPQHVGTLTDCLKQEKIKIYQYPLLPECLKRNFYLIRPPGNKQDN